MRFVKILNGWLKGIIKLIPQPERPKPEVEPASFPKLRDSVRQLMGLMAEARSNLERLQLDIEDYGAGSWIREKESKEKYYRMASSLFLLLDHLENLAKDKEKSDEIDWLYKRIRRILEDEGIEEIPAKKGYLFSGVYHEHVDDRAGEFPEHTVLKVVRKGYFIRGQTGTDDVILRPAEVIVSSGPPEKQPESKISEEVEK